MKHSVRSMYDAAGVSIVGNIAYLSNKQMPRQSLGKLAKWLPFEPWFVEISRGMGLTPLKGDWKAGWMALETLHLVMRNSGSLWISEDDPFRLLAQKGEPEWMNRLPAFAKRYIRSSYASTEGMNPLAIVPKFPYMGFGYIIPDSGLANDAVQTFHLMRLAGIKQLSFLHDPVLKEYDRSAGALMFDHTRYCHVLDTHAVANIISANIGFDEQTRDTLLTAAITHDALTPAGGDSVKLVDPVAFDEDVHYPELLVGGEWEEFRKRFGIDRDLLVQTIMGEGLLGRILDISDKSSYLARDVDAYLMTANPFKDARNTNYYAVADIVTSDPYVCAVWESARRYDGSLVFGDKERLGRFLKLRALMFRSLYYNPFSRFFEYLVGKGVVRYLYKTGQVTREQLLRERDEWIENKIDQVLGSYCVLRMFHNLEKSRIEEYYDVESAVKRAAEFDKDTSKIVILDDFRSSTGNGVRKFFVRDGNRAIPFAEACPRDAMEVEGIMTFAKRVRLYFFDADDLEIPVEGRAKLKELMKSVS